MDIQGQDAHQFRCPEYCEPGFSENLLQQAVGVAVAEGIGNIQGQEAAAIRTDYRKGHTPAIQAKVKEDMLREMFTTASQEHKAAEKKAWKNEVRAEESRKIQSVMDAKYEKDVEKEVNYRLENLWLAASDGRPPTTSKGTAGGSKSAFNGSAKDTVDPVDPNQSSKDEDGKPATEGFHEAF